MSGRGHGWDGIPLLDKDFRIRSLPPSYQTAEFEHAFWQAAALLTVWKADFAEESDLRLLASKISPLARSILEWALDELKAAQSHKRPAHTDPKVEAATPPRAKPKSGSGNGIPCNVIPFKGNGAARDAEQPCKAAATITTRYTCPGCAPPKQLWGKLGAHVFCGDCHAKFHADFVDA